MTNLLRHLLIAAFATALLGLAVPGVAAADGGDVLQDCAEDGSLDGDYSRGELRDARGQIEPDFATYSDCDEIIDSRLAPQAGASGSDRDGSGSGVSGAGGSDGAGGSGVAGDSASGGDGAPLTEGEQRRRELARAEVEEELGERSFDPNDAAAIDASDTANGLPLPVLLALIALGVLLAAGAALAIGKRKPGFAGALRRVPFPRRGS